MKNKLSISLDRETLEEIRSKVDSGIFRNTSHAVEFALNKLFEEENA